MIKLFIHLKKIKNTFFIPKLYDFFINNQKNKIIIKNQYGTSFINKVFFKILYFYPKFKQVQEWALGDIGKYRDYKNFEELKTYDIFILNKIISLIKDKNLPILDLGCNQGRHIRYLHQKGFRNIYGVDIMSSALEFFEKNFYDIYKHHNIECNLFEKYLKQQEENFFYSSYSFGATIELVHPSFDIIMYLVRVTKKYIILFINEDGHSFPRYYIYEFKKNNTDLVFYKKNNTLGENTIMIFKKKL